MRAPRPSGRACPSSTSARSCSYIATIDEGTKGGGLISTVFFFARGRVRYCGGGPTGPVRPGSPERALEHWEDLPHPSVYRQTPSLRASACGDFGGHAAAVTIRQALAARTPLRLGRTLGGIHQKAPRHLPSSPPRCSPDEASRTSLGRGRAHRRSDRPETRVREPAAGVGCG